MNNCAAPVVDLDGTGSARLNSFREQGEPVQAPPAFRNEERWQAMRAMLARTMHAANIDLDQQTDAAYRGACPPPHLADVYEKVEAAYHLVSSGNKRAAARDHDRETSTKAVAAMLEAVEALEELGG